METTVYFDLDGTLLNYTSPFSELFAQTLPVEATEEMVETYSERVLSGITNVAEEPYRQAFETVCREYNLNASPDSLAAEYIETEATATYISSPVQSLVETVTAHHQTGVLTNGDGKMQRRKLEEHGLTELMDTVIVSNEIGSRKPEQEIFEEAKQRLPADTFIYIGDTYEEDIVPARKAGFVTVYVGKSREKATPVAANCTEELANLLLPLLGEDSEP